MNKRQYLARAVDSSNGFGTFQSEAQAVNPNIWDRTLRDYEEKNLVVTQLAEQFDFRSPGVDYKVTVDEAPTAAAALVETTDVSITAITNRQVTFTPAEYGAAMQLTRSEAARAFFNVADVMTKKLGYMLAQKKDALGYTEITANAGNEVFVNSKTVASDLASTDTLDYDSILNAIKANEEDLYVDNRYLLVNYSQKQQLLALGTINQANTFGTRSAIEKGVVGELFGLQVVVTHSVTTTSNVAAAVVFGFSQTGESPLGYAIKRDPIIEREYHARGRYWDIVAHEEYDFATLHPNGLCLIKSYA